MAKFTIQLEVECDEDYLLGASEEDFRKRVVDELTDALHYSDFNYPVTVLPH